MEQEFFPGDYYGNFILGTGVEWYTLDRLMIVRILMAAIIGIFFVIAMRRPKLVPTGLQNVAEYFLDFVRIYIAEEILGKKDGKRFLPIAGPLRPFTGPVRRSGDPRRPGCPRR